VNSINYTALPLIQKYLDAMKFNVGEYKWSSRTDDFAGWIKCDGRSLSRSEYVELFAAIGTRFGADDSVTFKIPDIRGKVMGCVGTGNGLTPRNLGDFVGTETHLLTSNEIPSHTHTGTTTTNGNHSHTITDPGHTHTQTTINDDFNNSGANPPGFASDSAGTRTWSNINSSVTGISINAAGDHSHTFTTNASGGSNAHNNMQPTAFVGQVFIFAGYKLLDY
jgi:microcystin-dependent protein